MKSKLPQSFAALSGSSLGFCSLRDHQQSVIFFSPNSTEKIFRHSFEPKFVFFSHEKQKQKLKSLPTFIEFVLLRNNPKGQKTIRQKQSCFFLCRNSLNQASKKPNVVQETDIWKNCLILINKRGFLITHIMCLLV